MIHPGAWNSLPFLLLHHWFGCEVVLGFSKSLICTLNKVGDITEPCGTPKGQGCIDDRIPCKLTCCVLPVKKLLIHTQNGLLTFIEAIFSNRMLWFTRSKAFQKSINIAWTPFLPDCELSVALYQYCVADIKAETVDRPRVKHFFYSLC